MISNTRRTLRRYRQYCREPIEMIKNYDKAINDKEHYYLLHHINELTFTREELIMMNMYYNRPASEFIFLTHAEHRHLHKYCAGHVEGYIKRSKNVTGKPLTEEHRRNCSKGKKLWWNSEAGQKERERRRNNANIR